MGQLRPYPGFVGPSYTSESKIAAYDRTVNLYPERIESGTGTARYALYPSPGYSAAFTLDASPGRGGFTIADALYFVSGASFYSTSTFRGAVSNDSNAPVYMAGQGAGINQILVASDAATYVYNPDTHAFTNVGTTVSGLPYSIAYLNSYGLRLDPGLTQVEFSAPGDFTSWDPLDVFVREDAPDNWQRLLAFHNELWLFGTTTTSIYYNGDDVDFPFQPIKSAFMNMGIIAPHSACIVDGAPMWIGQGDNGGGVVYRASGYTPQRISTFAVEYAFAQSPSPLRLFEGSTYQENGHTFYELTLPGVMSWRYDVGEGLWHECGDFDGLAFVGLPVIGHAYLQQNDTELSHYTQSRTTGDVFYQSTSFSVGTDGVTGLTRLRRAPHILSAQNRIRYARLRVLMDVGITTIVPPTVGSDPTLALRWSDDGGQTWSSTYTASVGVAGAYSTLVDFWQLGQGRDRIFEFIASDPIPYRLIDCFLDYSVGPS